MSTTTTTDRQRLAPPTTVRLPQDDRDRLDQMAERLAVGQSEAVRVVIAAGLDALTNGSQQHAA